MSARRTILSDLALVASSMGGAEAQQPQQTLKPHVNVSKTGTPNLQAERRSVHFHRCHAGPTGILFCPRFVPFWQEGTFMFTGIAAMLGELVLAFYRNPDKQSRPQQSRRLYIRRVLFITHSDH